MVKVHIANEAEFEIVSPGDKDGCYTNKGFDIDVDVDDAGSVVSSLQDSVFGHESIASTAKRTGSFTNPAYEFDASVTRQDSGVGPETQMRRKVCKKGEGFGAMQGKNVELGNLIPGKCCFWREIFAILRGNKFIIQIDILVFFLQIFLKIGKKIPVLTKFVTIFQGNVALFFSRIWSQNQSNHNSYKPQEIVTAFTAFCES